MKNTFGSSLSVTLFGESHGPAVGAVADGLPPGVPVDEARIARELSRRRPASALDTARREPDRFQILSGVFAGKTTGAPLCIVIPNEDTRSRDYAYGPARPSHADYTAFCKYHGFEDYRGGGHVSGRVTAALVAVGGGLLPAREARGVRLGTHVLRCGGETDRAFETERDLALLADAAFPALDAAAGERMAAAVLRAKEEGDSVGGVTQTAVFGLPAGLGEPWFDSVESVLSHALYSIGGVKGVAFGDGFALAAQRGSAANDAFRVRDGRIVTETNANGGVNGGITNGMPVLFQCAVKPTPSIARPQRTVNFLTGEETELTIRGRHDPAIVRRVCPVIDAVTAIALCDLIAQRYGTDALGKGRAPWNTD
jgi:chorismate synthase